MHSTPPIVRGLLAASLFVAEALAQEAVYPRRQLSESFDSGFVSNPGAAEVVVYREDVVGTGDWLQLHFADANLPLGSRLKVFAPARPDWVQWHDARSLQDWQGWSCQFAGHQLRVELVAGPGTQANRVRIDARTEFDVGSVSEPDTICGTTDDRVLSSDPRSGRIDASCSAWLFSEFAVGTAGHCMTAGTLGKVLHFNVPLSSAAGTPQPSHPNDQYALSSFLQSLNGGVGADWATMNAVRNSNTRLYPGQAQGSWYTIVPAPAFAAGQVIRVTGYGTGNGSTGSPTANQAQKTHTGLRQTTATATALRYGTDTTGGNSGSAILAEATGFMIGVHTHGGCSSTGGGNSGTDAVRADFAAARALALAQHTVGSITQVGSGCGQSSAPILMASGLPEITEPLTLMVAGLGAAPSFGWFLLGHSNATWNGVPLPAPLDAIGVEGCLLRTAIDFSDSIAGTGNVVGRAYTMPNDPGLVGTHIYFQYFGLTASATTTSGIAGSNAVDVLLGN